jgi:peptidoglycan/LPS O-acetylase OafA/YrhL
MEAKKERFKNIEILRLIFIISIVVYHLFSTVSPLNHIYPSFPLFVYLKNNLGVSGPIAVDLFFVISGFLLINGLNTNQTVLQFLKHKFVRFFPALFFCYVFSYILAKIGLSAFYPYENLLSLFFLNHIGITFNYGLTGSWFVSVIVSVSVFYFYIIKHFDKKYSDFIIIMLSLGAYLVIIQVLEGAISSDNNVNLFIFQMGTLRALAGMGLGFVVYNIYKEVKAITYNHSVKKYLAYSALELVTFLYVVYNLFHNVGSHYQILIILAFAILLYLFALKRGCLSQLLENNFSNSLGRYAYSTFLLHFYVINIFILTWKINSSLVFEYPIWSLVLPVACSLIFAVFVYHVVERPMQKFLSERIE